MIRKILHRIRKRWQGNAIILMYHRVDHVQCDPWELNVSPENFEHQLKCLKKYNVIGMSELTESISENKNLKNSIALTFDDGYLDNFTHAAPLLKKYNLPATFYITTGNIGTDQKFWWDELQNIILLADLLPEKISLTIAGENFAFDLADEAKLNQKLFSEIKTWHAEGKPINKRTALYFSLWKKLQALGPGARSNALHEIKQHANANSVSSGQMMNWEQVQSLGTEKLFSIGAHTINHPALGMHSASFQKKEIDDSRSVLKEKLNKEIFGFAYPHGNYNRETISILNEESFHHAVTTEAKPVTLLSPLLELPRFQVKDWNENTFHMNLKNWFKKN
jgi:peptidoglycan/xylan/chitin deacetylase (PgdA/CDA1 family)